MPNLQEDSTSQHAVSTAHPASGTQLVLCRIEAIWLHSPREEELDRLVQQLNVDEKLAPKRVRRAVDVRKVHNRVDAREERAVQPAPALRDELGHLRREEQQVSCRTSHTPDTPLLRTWSGTSVTACADLT